MKRLQATLIVSRPHRGVLFTCPGDLSPLSCWRSDGIVYRGQWSRADGLYTLQEAAPDGVDKEVFAGWAGMAIDQCADNLAAYADMDTGEIPSGARAVIDDDGNVVFLVSMVAGDLDGRLPEGLAWERVR